ncbi:Glycoside hydrolase, catalytic core [Purpureocillium lilacinum]|uniref:beta-N-acetylhexosaminidase n=1 Tax=Purpureocillium lilacinum TaxID=33203 RepID=A0A2U3EKD0_PURLI|nr:Glycoside hydrolase, catalytic core [Purpureocillium lilacinum]
MKGSLLSALTATLSLFPGIVQSQLVGIPTVPFTQSGDGGFQLRRIKRIVVDSKFADERDTSGLTLIPPTLHDFASTFAQDLHETLGVQARVVVEDSPSRHGADGDAVFLTLSSDKSAFRDAAGRPTAEGYSLTADGAGSGGSIVISGASPLGAWWGTRTVLQQAVLRPGSGSGSGSGSSSGDTGATFPLGTGVDAPGWGERGMMLDCARHFYPKEFLADLCSYMSFFKQNTLQLHLSDNIIASHYTPDNFRDLYARFRLWSDGEAVRGLSTHRNESYSRDEFDWIQRRCAARGVAVLPEIEAPGHALPIVQWKPQVGYEGDLSLLNISHPDTIPTMKTIWKEFLPWFHSKVVSIGADEYLGPESEYKKLVNALDTFIQGESGKTIRIWGTFPPKKGTPSADEISTDVSIQHWAYAFDNPLNDYLKNNYSVINSDEMYYVVIKCCAYARRVDISKTFTGDPADKGPWRPNIFSTAKAADNAPRDEPLIQGAITPIWNDRGANTSVYSEAYYAWQDGIPALADKQWGGNLTRSQFDNVFPKLHGPVVPAQNLERTVPSRGSTIFKYDLSRQRSKCIKDLSPNRYHAKTTCRTTGSSVRIAPECSVTTPLESKGRNYTLSLTIKVDKLDDPTNTTILTGGDSTLMLTPNLTLFAAGIHFRLDKGIPLKEWVTVKIVGRGEQTFASVESKSGGSTGEMEFQAGITQGDKAGTIKWFPVAVEAPIRAVTGWTGELRALSLTGEA